MISASGRDEGVVEGSDLFLWDGPDELIDELSADEGEDGRDAFHLERLCDLGVLVRVDLDELDLAVSLVGELFQDRTEDATGAAPGRPAVDHDRQLVRTLDHVSGEGCVGRIDDGGDVAVKAVRLLRFGRRG